MISDQSFSGRRVVITGAGRGLGRALAIKIADHGAETALLGRDRAALQAVAETIRSRTASPTPAAPSSPITLASMSW
jgi:NAD(P)-dependent dehydrogenase (short-subunit alcohol dehydrogenase family)